MLLCYPQALDQGALTALLELSSRAAAEPLNSLILLKDLLVCSLESPLYKRLQKVLTNFSRDMQSSSQSLRVVGDCWVALSRTLIDWYIPNLPIDPHVICDFDFQYWKDQRQWITSQLHLYKLAEQNCTGNNMNSRISALEETLAHSDKTCPVGVSFLPRTEGNKLASFWSEVQRFMVTVIPHSKVDDIILTMSRQYRIALARKKVMDESIEGFLNRISSDFPGFDDLASPIELAFRQLRFGMDILAQASLLDNESPKDSPEIASFPSIAVMTSISKRTIEFSPHQVDLVDLLLLRLSSVANILSTGVGLAQYVFILEDAYDKLTDLWLQDCAREEDEKAKSESLYRLKSAVRSPSTKLDLDEDNVESLFPTFEAEHDLLEHVVHESIAKTLDSSSTLRKNVQDDTSRLVYDLHLFLMGNNSTASKHILSIWERLRAQSLNASLDIDDASVNAHTDFLSLPYRLQLLYNQHRNISESLPGVEYDFYTSHNIVEVKRASNLVTALRRKASSLADQWPDQMVLRDLRDRCDQFLSQPLTSSVAKVLVNLERLLLQSEDWELHANRENSLKDHQRALSALIVEWRQLELFSWRGLLAAQIRLFKNDVAHWWFPLYDVVIRGVSAAVQTSQSTLGEALNGYFAELIPLLEQYIGSSPLGQFSSRMALLESFHRLLKYVEPRKSGQFAAAVQRTAVIVLSLYRQYDQFSTKVEARLKEQTQIIEQGMAACIKSASWKDNNVWVLQQSARRTHRQLYKLVRKFRDMLRQPVTALLCHAEQLTKETLDGSVIPFTHESHIFASPLTVERPVAHGDTPKHFGKFSNLLTRVLTNLLPNGSTILLEEFSMDIIDTVKELANGTPPPDLLDATRLQSWRKTLLARKRKAFADVLKDLRRIGCPPAIKPDLLKKQTDRLALLELSPPHPFYTSNDVIKAEAYFVRAIETFSILRNSISNLHSDVSPRDFQRSILTLERTLSIALRCRSRYTHECNPSSPYQLILSVF